MFAKHTYLYFLPIVVVLLFSSCTSEVPDDVATGNQVTFVVPDLSRASVTTNLSYSGSEFVIFGDMKFMDNPQTIIFDNSIVRYQGGKWVYDNTQYWFPKHNHSFIAMHPVSADGISGRVYSESRLSFSYTQPDNYKNANDLMLATHRREIGAYSSEQTNISEAPVSLKFWHIMSRINFLVTNDRAADIVKVEKIELEGVNRTGTFSITPASLLQGSKETDDYDYSWTGISNPGNLTANINIEIPENEARPLFPDDDALLVLPQPDNKNVIMRITYTLIDEGADDQHFTLTAEAPIGGWKPGKAYTYSMEINEISTEIYLTVSVKNWQGLNSSTNIPVPES